MKYSWILRLVFWNVLHHITELIDNVLLIPFGWFMITNQGQRDHKKWYNALCILSSLCLQKVTDLYFLKNFKDYQKKKKLQSSSMNNKREIVLTWWESLPIWMQKVCVDIWKFKLAPDDPRFDWDFEVITSTTAHIEQIYNTIKQYE